MNRITLCTIARNEEAMLADCLASVRGLVDKIVVVDTGSSDRTVEIAEAAGARVIHHTWDDDFSAARNAAIAHVKNGYVLILDADERLAASAHAIIKNAVQVGKIDGARLPLHNASSTDASHAEVLSGAASLGPPMLLERLLKRTPDLQWEGVVHEHITTWAKTHTNIVTLEAPIVHLGSVPELRERLGKSDRNLRLLRVASEQEPDNIVYRTYLAHELISCGDITEAEPHLEAAWKRLTSLHAANQPAPDAVPTATAYALILSQSKRTRLARAVISQAQGWSTPHPNLLFLSADLNRQEWVQDPTLGSASSLLEDAAKSCEQALALDGKAFGAAVMHGATSWNAATCLGTIRLLQQQASAAEQAFSVALGTKPQHIEALLGQAEALIIGGSANIALDQLTQLLHPKLVDGWVLAAWAGFQFGGYSQVAPMVEQAARSLKENCLMAPHREEILNKLQATAPASISA